MSDQRATLAAALAFAAVVAVISYRTWTKLDVVGDPNPLQWGLADFRDAIYYPTVALLEGRNPYDTDAYRSTYPVMNRFPAYLPTTLLVHAPFGLLPVRAAQLAYYVTKIVLTLVLAALALSACGIVRTRARVLGVATLILASRAGHWNLMLGQYAVTLAIGSYLALMHARTRPWVAGLGLALTTIKPTYGGPLALMMLVRGDWLAVLGGVAVSAIGTALVTARLAVAAGGVGPLVGSIYGNLATFNTVGSGHAVESLFRLDAVSVVSRIVGHELGLLGGALVTGGILALGIVAVRACARRPDDPNAARLSAAAICLTVLLVCYHMGYDLVLLTWPLVALVGGCWAPVAVQTPSMRWALTALLAVPAFNYVASRTLIADLPVNPLEYLLISGANGALLIVALVLYTVTAVRGARA